MLIFNKIAYLYMTFPFLDGDDPRGPSYCVYISQLIGFARASSQVSDSIVVKSLNCQNS